jgi:hypothetical protein
MALMTERRILRWGISALLIAAALFIAYLQLFTIRLIGESNAKDLENVVRCGADEGNP